MLGSLEIRLSFPCDACDTGIPVNGPVPLVKCSRCLEVTRLEGHRGWDKLLEKRLFVYAARGNANLPDERSGGKPTRVSANLRFPACSGCGKERDQRQVKIALMKKQPITCSCGVALALQPVPPAFAAAHPYVKGFFDADLFDETGATQAVPASGGPVAMACMKCQAPLAVDGSRRLVECSYCSTRNYLPDDLWLSLHPVLKRESWFVLFDIDDVLTSVGL